MEKIKIDLGFGILVAEINNNASTEGQPMSEISVSLEDKNGNFIQDVALVGQAVNPQTMTPIPDALRCLVWADPQDESYTHEHVIEKYTGEE